MAGALLARFGSISRLADSVVSGIRSSSDTTGASRAKAGIAVAEAEIVLDVLAAVAEPVEPHFLRRPRLTQ
jgi:hypothetical protein